MAKIPLLLFRQLDMYVFIDSQVVELHTGKSFSEAPIYSRNSLFWTKWLEDGGLSMGHF